MYRYCKKAHELSFWPELDAFVYLRSHVFSPGVPDTPWHTTRAIPESHRPGCDTCSCGMMNFFPDFKCYTHPKKSPGILDCYVC